MMIPKLCMEYQLLKVYKFCINDNPLCDGIVKLVHFTFCAFSRPIDEDLHDHLSRVMRKPAFCICENKDADQLRSYCAAEQRFIFATQIAQSLFFLNPKFQASSHLL